VLEWSERKEKFRGKIIQIKVAVERDKKKAKSI
jgi:hypothetical protein